MTTITTAEPSQPLSARSSWFSILNLAIVARALVVALILGSVLTAANQPAAVFGDATLILLPLVLVYLTPFVVVVLSQILGIRQALRDGRPLANAEGFRATMFAHGIPARAVSIGLLMGVMNTSATAIAVLVETGGLAGLPVSLLAQAFGLPVIFGVLSQAISYRRAAARFSERA